MAVKLRDLPNIEPNTFGENLERFSGLQDSSFRSTTSA